MAYFDIFFSHIVSIHTPRSLLSPSQGLLLAAFAFLFPIVEGMRVNRHFHTFGFLVLTNFVVATGFTRANKITLLKNVAKRVCKIPPC
jgi:hypothetical protein